MQDLKPSTGASVPKSGLITKYNQYVERVVGARNSYKFILQGLIFTLSKSIPTIIGSLLRGKIYSILLGNIGNSTLIEKNVIFNIPNRIFLGKRVVLGESSVVDPKGIYGKIVIKNDVHVQRLCRLTTEGTKHLAGELIIEDNVYMGPYGYIHAAGKITIGPNCLFGPRVTIIAGNHGFRRKDIPIRFQAGIAKNIQIGEDVWLSANVTILGNVKIGKGAVVAAGAVVTKDLPPYSISAGVPAKIIGYRE